MRDIEITQIDQLKQTLPETIFKRCQYVVEENERVVQAKTALKKNNIVLLGKLMYQSHEGLKNLYEVSCAELDFLVAFTKNKSYILGSRMMGGGFGGCTISIIASDQKKKFVEKVTAAYQQQFGIALSPYSVSIEDGAHIISI